MMNLHRTIALSTLLLCAACHQQQNAPSSGVAQPSSSPASMAPPTPDWAKLIVGEWHSTDVWPTGGKRDNCTTDYTFAFFSNGTYGVDSGSGTWRLNGDVVSIRVTSTEVDDDNGDDTAGTDDKGHPVIKTQPLNPPYTASVRLSAIKGPVITTIADGKAEYWYRCADKP